MDLAAQNRKARGGKKGWGGICCGRKANRKEVGRRKSMSFMVFLFPQGNYFSAKCVVNYQKNAFLPCAAQYQYFIIVPWIADAGRSVGDQAVVSSTLLLWCGFKPEALCFGLFFAFSVRMPSCGPVAAAMGKVFPCFPLIGFDAKSLKRLYFQVLSFALEENKAESAG